MQRKILLGGLAVLSVIGAGGVALAQQAPARPSAEMSRADFVARRVERLSVADANRDGQVTAEERIADRQAKRADRGGEAFDRLDANRDGMLSREEFQARPMRAGRAGPERPARAERMDRPAVSVAEAQARAERAFDRLDADRNGVLTAEERRAGRQETRETRRERRMGRGPAARGASPEAATSE